jgi:putative phosphoesterase
VRLAVMADVHGNLPALNAVLRDVQQHAVDGIIVAGDLVGGPQAVETTRLLRSLGSWMIRGNSDSNLLRYDRPDAPPAWRTSHQFALLRWSYRHVDEETFEFIKSLPQQRVVQVADTPAIRVVHGSPRDASESIFPHRDAHTLDVALAQTEEAVLVCGHTHRPWKVERSGQLALNPGAVCGPLDGYVGTQYALLTWDGARWAVEHRAVPYNLDHIRAAFHQDGLLEEGGALARAYVCCLETGRNVWDDFLSHAYRLAEQAGHEDCQVVPDPIWERAAATFNWATAVRGDVR